MLDLKYIQRSVSHDPNRRGDRSPFGAVPVGTVVKLVLRVVGDMRHAIRDAWIEIEEDSSLGDNQGYRRVPLQPCDQGLEGFVDTAGEPRVIFYRFRLVLDDGEILFANRADGMSTAGDARSVTTGWCAVGGEEAAADCAPNALPQGFQLTLYDPSFAAPRWFGGGAMYQIFPDRFARGESGILRSGVQAHERRGWPVSIHEDWNEAPAWGESYDPVDFFGGSLEGIESKLDYLESLGVKTIYLNPIVEARSNHRYNTGDYEQVDPILGSWDDFESLCRAAKERGMEIMLDTVLSHTGSSSKYFNLDNSYDSFGAAQGEQSPYRSWYDFATYADKVPPYRAWWGDATLPEVEEHEPSWQQYVLGQGGILHQWISHGVRGLRLDVADELPDDVLELIRQSVHSVAPSTAILGEVWEDPTIKESYGRRRTYALGRALDSVMNYPLRSALLQFALGTTNAPQLVTFLRTQRINYPEPLYHSLMNLLSSHDVERVRSVLAVGREFRELDRNEQAELVAGIEAEDDRAAARLQELLAAVLYTMPGVPCLYYGDERGMHGGRDPFDRGTFPWDGQREDCGVDLTETYRALGQLRADSHAFKHGESAFYGYGKNAVCIARVGNDGAYLCVINRGEAPLQYGIDLLDVSSGLSDTAVYALSHAHGPVECVFATDDSEQSAEYLSGILTGRIDAGQACIFHIDCAYHSDVVEADEAEEAVQYTLPGSLSKKLEPGCGVICHITSVPNDGAPGTLGAPAKRFVDALARAGARYWQILPLNPTDEYGSPYAGLSAFAGNTRLLEQREGCEYEIAEADQEAFEVFVERNAAWLKPYATFIAIKRHVGEVAWQQWPAEYRDWSPELLERPELYESAQAEMRLQFAFDQQWRDLLEYAHERGVQILGDMPIYVSCDSSDVWANKQFFMLTEEGYASQMGGVPPDQFAAEGQLWGNPTYNWVNLTEQDYAWWIDRLHRMFELYDYVRIDHFIGFNSYYAIPAGLTAADGTWLPGPSLTFFQNAYRKLGKLPVIAEDLGIITPEVVRLMGDTGFPGMDVIQFSDGDARYDWRPKPNKIVFTGTHDTQTLLGWVKERFGLRGDQALEQAREFRRKAMECDADVIMFPLQDVLELDNDARMNVPGTAGENWAWRANQADIDRCLTDGCLIRHR